MCYCFINEEKFHDYNNSVICESVPINQSEQIALSTESGMDQSDDSSGIVLANFEVESTPDSKTHICYNDPITGKKIASFLFDIESFSMNSPVFPRTEKTGSIEVFLDNDRSHVIELNQTLKIIDEYLNLEEAKRQREIKIFQEKYHQPIVLSCLDSMEIDNSKKRKMLDEISDEPIYKKAKLD
jgi:hypothetical protein